MSESKEGNRILGLIWESKPRPKEAICITIRKMKKCNSSDDVMSSNVSSQLQEA